MNSSSRGMQVSTAIACAVLVGATMVATTQACTAVAAERRAGTAAPTKPAADYGRLPLAFEANQGQSDGQVKFLARGDGYSLFLTATEAVLSLRAPAPSSTVVRMRLVDANAQPTLTGLDPMAGLHG